MATWSVDREDDQRKGRSKDLHRNPPVVGNKDTGSVAPNRNANKGPAFITCDTQVKGLRDGLHLAGRTGGQEAVLSSDSAFLQRDNITRESVNQVNHGS